MALLTHWFIERKVNVFGFLINVMRRFRQQLPSQLGINHVISPSAVFIAPNRISIGDYAYVGPQCYLEGKGGISIGDGVVLGPRVSILSSSHQYENAELLPFHEYDEYKKVVIGNGVWLGFGATVVPGVRIADGAVVAMGAVVTRDVREGVVVGGNPAVPIGKRMKADIEELVDRQAYFRKKHWGKEPQRPGITISKGRRANCS